jgi:hypothetical protein
LDEACRFFIRTAGGTKRSLKRIAADANKVQTALDFVGSEGDGDAKSVADPAALKSYAD